MIVDLIFYDNLQVLQHYAKLLGIDAVIIAKGFKSPREIDALRANAKNYKIPIYICHLLEKPNFEEARLFREKADFISIVSGTANTNKFAVSSSAIDFVISPAGSGRNEFDTAIARIAAENKKPIAVPFQQFLNCNGMQRSMLFKNYFFVVKLMKKFRINALFFSGAKNANEMRMPKNLASFAHLLSFNTEQAERFIERYAETILPKVKK